MSERTILIVDDEFAIRDMLRMALELAEKARKDENTVPAILEAVRNYATVGELCDALREVWGEWTAKPSLAMNYSSNL